MQIEELVNGLNIESSNVEFKGILREGKKKEDGTFLELGWLKTIAAFANTQGGEMYVGVEDKTHKVVALDHETADRMIRMIHHQIREKIDPAIRYEISTIPVPDTMPIRYVIKITVPVSAVLPVTVHCGGMMGIYVRDYGQTQTASSEQIRNLVRMSDHVPYDTPFVSQQYRKEDFTVLGSYLHKIGVKTTQKEWISVGFLSPGLNLSKGSLLFRDDCQALETKMVMSLWKGFDKGGDVVLAQQEYCGNLLEGIQQAIAFVRDHSANGFVKKAQTREKYLAYPERAVTEGIVNAVGHRNYFIQGSQIEINLFRDRLEITSPGALLGVRKLEHETRLASIIPRMRNEVICAALQICRYMEEKGSGFEKIEEDYQTADQTHKPFVTSGASYFTLTLPDLTYHAGVTDGNTDVVPQVTVDSMTTGRHDLEILGYCYYQPRSVKEIADYLGLRPSTYFRTKVIQRLVKDGYLIETAGERGSQYQSSHIKVMRV